MPAPPGQLDSTEWGIWGLRGTWPLWVSLSLANCSWFTGTAPGPPSRDKCEVLRWLVCLPERWHFTLPSELREARQGLKEALHSRYCPSWRQHPTEARSAQCTGLPAMLPMFRGSQKSQCNQARDPQVPPCPWGEHDLYDLGGWEDSVSPLVRQDSTGGCLSQPGLGGPAPLPPTELSNISPASSRSVTQEALN